jgi:hypothetical protein
MNSSTLMPLCFRMSDRVPLASSECMGTTVLNTLSPARFSKETWLPFWRSSTKPALFNAHTTRSPETLGSLDILVGDFYGSPEGLAFGRPLFGNAPGFQVKLDGFAEVSASALNILSLRCDAQLGAASDIKTIFFGNERGKSVIHNQMLTEAKAVKQESVTIHELRITRNHGRRNK